jgi:uncharacterized oxidoreductase
MELKGKKILITGGASGIGLEAAKQLLASGATVIITGRNQSKLDAAKELYPALTVIKSDVSDADDAKKLFSQMQASGGIDILYNNAGVLTEPYNLGVANDRHYEDAAYEINVNYLGVIYLNNLFIEMLKSRKEGAIINTTSILAYVPALMEATYSASKAALHFYTQALRTHLKVLNSKLKIFELLPPVVATDMTADRNDSKMSAETLVKALISGLRKEQYTIRVGDTRSLYILHRFFPTVAYNLVNAKKYYKKLEA